MNDEPAFYAIPAELYEILLDKLEDVELVELVELVRKRENQPEIEVNIESHNA